MLEEIQCGAEQEYNEEKERKERKQQNAALQKEQHSEMKQKYIKRMQEDKIEGEIIKLQV